MLVGGSRSQRLSLGRKRGDQGLLPKRYDGLEVVCLDSSGSRILSRSHPELVLASNLSENVTRKCVLLPMCYHGTMLWRYLAEVARKGYHLDVNEVNRDFCLKDVTS